MARQSVRIKLNGVSPILMHAPTTVDVLSPEAKALKKITAKKTNKTESDILEMRRIEWHASIYHDDTLGPYIPAENIERCFGAAAAVTRDGKKVQRGFLIDAEYDIVPVLYSGPRGIVDLWANGDGRYMDLRSVKIGQSATTRCRPRFDEWAVEFTGSLEDTVLSTDAFAGIVESAGRTTGLGDFRPRFGRFDATVEFE